MKIVKIALKDIEQNENSRVIYKEVDLADLMHSMKNNGLLQPIGVKRTKGGFECVFGNRRLVAAKRIGWADIDAHVLEAETENDRDILGLIENLKRQNTTVSEDGRIFDALQARGLSLEEISVRVGVPKVRIETALEVYRDFPKEFRAVIVNRSGGTKKPGTISATAAAKIMNLRKTHGLSRKQTRKLLSFAQGEDTSTQHLEQIAPLLRMGLSLDKAITRAGNLERFTLYFFMESSHVKKMEKKYDKTISEIVWAKLAELKPAKEALNETGSYVSKMKAEHHHGAMANGK